MHSKKVSRYANYARNFGMISFQKYGTEEYHCNSLGTSFTLWDLDLSSVLFKPGDNNIHYSDIVRNII